LARLKESNPDAGEVEERAEGKEKGGRKGES
jgi:hypothetical protein